VSPTLPSVPLNTAPKASPHLPALTPRESPARGTGNVVEKTARPETPVSTFRQDAGAHETTLKPVVGVRAPTVLAPPQLPDAPKPVPVEPRRSEVATAGVPPIVAPAPSGVTPASTPRIQPAQTQTPPITQASQSPAIAPAAPAPAKPLETPASAPKAPHRLPILTPSEPPALGTENTVEKVILPEVLLSPTNQATDANESIPPLVPGSHAPARIAPLPRLHPPGPTPAESGIREGTAADAIHTAVTAQPGLAPPSMPRGQPSSSLTPFLVQPGPNRAVTPASAPKAPHRLPTITPSEPPARAAQNVFESSTHAAAPVTMPRQTTAAITPPSPHGQGAIRTLVPPPSPPAATPPVPSQRVEIPRPIVVDARPHPPLPRARTGHVGPERPVETGERPPPAPIPPPPIRLEPPTVVPSPRKLDENGGRSNVRIGSLEVRILPVPVAPPTAGRPVGQSARAVAPPAAPLCRGFRAFGLGQG